MQMFVYVPMIMDYIKNKATEMVPKIDTGDMEEVSLTKVALCTKQVLRNTAKKE